MAMLIAGVLGCFATLVLEAWGQHSLPCHVLGSAAFTAPDNACTPGAYRVLSRSAVCSTKDRPTLPAADRRKVVGEYGVPRWSGANGELDHRVPLSDWRHAYRTLVAPLSVAAPLVAPAA
jgi:hypothetical protein